MSLRNTLAGFFILAAIAGARSQQLPFSTLAGYPGTDSSDGSVASARFVNPIGVATDPAGNVYVSDTGNHTIRKITPSGAVTTLAGLAGVSGIQDGSNSAARFNHPGGLALDPSGNIFVADTDNHTIRKITPAGVVSTFAGTAGVPGSLDALGTFATFNSPHGVVVAGGYVFVADFGNHSIRKITAGGSVSTFAGSSGNSGSADGVGPTARFFQPQGITADTNGILYVADTANGTIRKISTSAAVTTLAGKAGTYGTNDGVGILASFYEPEAVAVDAATNVYVADYANQTIRVISPAAAVTTLAGLAGFYGTADGTNSAARFRGPEGIALDNSGQIYVADTGNSSIRKIAILQTVVNVTTYAGSPSAASADGVGNNARFYWSGGIAASGGVAYIADTENNTIRKLTAAGLATTIAGTPGLSGSNNGPSASALFAGPQGIAADAAGNIFVADSANSTIRKIALDGQVTTIAGIAGTNGSLDGTAGEALFANPQSVALDAGGNIYVADTYNHTIRKVTPAGVVSTIAGYPGVYGDADGSNSAARFKWPTGIAVDAATNIYVADYFNHLIRQITPVGTDWAVTTIAGRPGVLGSADGPGLTIGTNSGARFNCPSGIAVANSTNLYVVDSGNGTIRNLSLGTNWTVTTVAGVSGAVGSTNGVGTGVRFKSPSSIAVGSGGVVYVTDSGNSTIRLSVLSSNPNFPVIINQPLSQTVDPGTNVTFSVVAAGGAPLSYQWRFNGVNIGGATSNIFTISNVQFSSVGNYSVVVTNSTGSAVSADAALIVNQTPFISAQPQSVVVGLGDSASFSVSAGGTPPLTYQWQFQGSPIPGAISTTFTVPLVEITNAGAYSVIVKNGAGTTVSSDAILSITALVSLGDDSFGQSEPSLGATNAIALAAGSWHTLALLGDGHVRAWGNDYNGQSDVPATLTDALAIAGGGYHSAAIRVNGTVLAWGANDYGQTNVPAGLSNVVAVACGTWHTLALKSDGTVVGWGDNTRGQLTFPPGLSNIIAVAAGGNHSLALKTNGTVIAWGENTGHNGTYAGQSVVPPGLANVIRIAAGDFHSLAVLSNGTVVAWGDNAQGQCTVPGDLTGVAAIAGGGAHSLALKSDGTVAAWGSDAEGQCDLPATLSNVIAIAAGEEHSAFLIGGAQPALLLWNPEWQNGVFHASAQTLNGKNYALEYSVSLAPQLWIPVSTNAGNGSLKMLTDPNASGSSRFYRVRSW